MSQLAMWESILTIDQKVNIRGTLKVAPHFRVQGIEGRIKTV